MVFSRWLSATKNLHPHRRSIEAKIRHDPYYRFSSLAELAIAGQLGIRIDVNQAKIDDWLRLPGISIHQARILVQLTESGVQLLSVEDIASAIGVSVARIIPLAPVLDFCYYDPQSMITPSRINTNTASMEELQGIPFVDGELARKIIQLRQEKGEYKSIVDLQKRLSLDSQLTSQLMYFLQF